MDRKITPPKKRTWLYYSGGAIILISLFFILYPSFSDSTVRLEKNNMIVKEVKLLPFQEFISVDGIVLPKRTVVIDALISGKVVGRLVENGAILNENDPILALENLDLQLDILNKETAVLDLINNIRQTQINLELNNTNRKKELTDTEYQLREAKRLFTINQKLWEEKIIAQTEFEASRNLYEFQHQKWELLRTIKTQDSISSREQLRQMKISLDQANKNLALMKTKLNDLLVRAPIDGQLTNFDLEEGQLLNMGENIGQIDEMGGFKIRAQVDQFYLNRIAVGQTATIDLNGTIHHLKIVRVFPTVANSFFSADLEFETSPPTSITRGQNLMVKIELSQARESLVLPKGSFYQSTGGQWVFLLSADGRSAYRHEVKLGKQNPEFFEVLEGLQEGDKVVVSSYNGFENYTELNF